MYSNIFSSGVCNDGVTKLTGKSLNGYINRRLSSLFIMLVIIIAVVFFLLEGFIGQLTYTYLYDLTIDMVFSSLEHFEDTLIAYESTYDSVLRDMIEGYHQRLILTDLSFNQLNDDELDLIFQDLILEYSREFDLIGLDSSNYDNIYYYIIDHDGIISKTNNRSQLSEEFFNYEEISSLLTSDILLERFTYEEDYNYLRKNGYIYLDDYIVKFSLPLDSNIVNDLCRRFDSMEGKFVFLSEIAVFKDIYTPLSEIFDYPSVEESEYFSRLSAEENSFKKSLNRNAFVYYTYWENDLKDSNYINQAYYIKVRMDYSDNILILSRIITLFICLILIIALFSIFLINRHFSKKIAAPFIRLAENMSKLGSNSDLTAIDESLEKTNIKEVNMLLGSYQEMTGELGSTFQELKAINEELEESYRETSVLAENLNNVIHVAAKLTDNIFDDVESFLKELFYVAKKLIPEADYGTVFVVENSKVKWLEAIGHSLEKIRSVPVDLDYYGNLDEVVYLKKIDDENDSKKHSNLLKSFLAVKKPIKSFITVQLFVGDELAGALNYDIAKSSNQEFSRQSIETIKAFGSLASAFLTMQSYKYMHEMFQREIILAIINILEIHDSYTKGHSENVARISSLLAKEMGFSSEEIKHIEWAGLVHDIGKILISKKILNKKGVLTAGEYNQIKKHTIWGYEVLVSSEELKEIAIYVRHHHERWDGTGYPDKLQGREIPLIARIIALADSWDTMRSDRVYRRKLSREMAIQELKDNRGKQFAPEVVDVALKLIAEGKLN